MDVVLEYGKKGKKTISVKAVIDSEELIEKVKSELDRTDIVVEQYNKEKDIWIGVTGEVLLETGDKLKIGIVAAKVTHTYTSTYVRISCLQIIGSVCEL